jgi:hypothetical protein
MTAENFTHTMRQLQDRRPYQAFTVELITGERHEIDFPNAFSVRDGVLTFIAPGGIPVWFDHESVNQIIGAQSDVKLK